MAYCTYERDMEEKDREIEKLQNENHDLQEKVDRLEKTVEKVKKTLTANFNSQIIVGSLKKYMEEI